MRWYGEPASGPSVQSIAAVLVEWAAQALGVAVVLTLLARLLVYLPLYRNYRTPSGRPAITRSVGFLIILIAAIVATGAFNVDRWLPEFATEIDFGGFAVLAVAVGVVGSAILSIGFASFPVVDAKVLAPDGSSNEAWAIEVLDQISSAHREGSSKSKVRARSNRTDVGDVIKVADRSGSGMTALVAWLLQLFLNSAPWLVQVTILDGVSGTATLRRNNHVIEEAPLRLQVGDAGEDNHRKLLILASSFAAMGIASRYSDITGFYGVERWQSTGYANLAMQTADEERAAYIEAALVDDPSNLIAEYEELLELIDDPTNEQSLSELMARLEPMIMLASILGGEEDIDLDADAWQWHVALMDRVEAHRRAEPDAAMEPPHLMLRLMDWYLGAAGNRLAWQTASGGPPDDGSDAVARRNVAQVLSTLAGLLVRDDVLRRISDREEIERLRVRVALSDRVLAPWAGPQYDPSLQQQIEKWFARARGTTNPDLQFLFACMLCHEALRTDDEEDRADAITEISECVAYAKFSTFYRDWAFQDPELRLLGTEPRLRELALSDIEDARKIDRFAEVFAVLPVRALDDPALIDARILAAVDRSAHPDLGDLRHVADGVEILAAARLAGPPGLDERSVLRAVRYLLDDADHGVLSLEIMGEHGREKLVDGVAAAVFWVPDDDERAVASAFVGRLLQQVANAAAERDRSGS